MVNILSHLLINFNFIKKKSQFISMPLEENLKT